MARHLDKEHLQPALLDRLIDEDRSSRLEPLERRTLTLAQLRQAVIRDLSWLFNTSSLETTQDLEAFPEVARSVLNYGVPEFAGKALSGVDVYQVEQRVRRAIIAFEPRILEESLQVRLVVREDGMDRNALVFDIEGRLWAHPMPLHLLLKTEVDLETGQVTVTEDEGRGLS